MAELELTGGNQFFDKVFEDNLKERKILMLSEKPQTDEKRFRK